MLVSHIYHKFDGGHLFLGYIEGLWDFYPSFLAKMSCFGPNWARKWLLAHMYDMQSIFFTLPCMLVSSMCHKFDGGHEFWGTLGPLICQNVKKTKKMTKKPILQKVPFFFSIRTFFFVNLSHFAKLFWRIYSAHLYIWKLKKMFRSKSSENRPFLAVLGPFRALRG